MQNILGQLQKMIKSQFGFESELNLVNEENKVNVHSPYGYIAKDKQVLVPIFDNNKEKVIATFTVNDVTAPTPETVENINDLVHVTLQSYLDLMTKLNLTTDILQHMQIDATPSKIIPLNRHRKTLTSLDWSKMLQPEKDGIFDTVDVLNREILLFGRNKGDLQKLFVHLHEVSKNQSLITLDENASSLLTSGNDILELNSTTIAIPNLRILSDQQLKTLTQALKAQSHKEQDLLIVATIDSLNLDMMKDRLIIDFLKQLHFFYVLSDQRESHGANFATLQLCAETIVQMVTSRDRNEKDKAPYTRSYNIVPLLKATPTLLH